MVWTFPFSPKSKNLILPCWFKFLKVFCFFLFSDRFLQLCSCWQKIESTIEHTHKVCVCVSSCAFSSSVNTRNVTAAQFVSFGFSVAITSYGKILPLQEASLFYYDHPIHINSIQNNFMLSVYSPCNCWTRKLAIEETNHTIKEGSRCRCITCFSSMF